MKWMKTAYLLNRKRMGRTAGTGIILLFLFLESVPVLARNEDGTIKLIRYPISSRPAIVRPGDTIAVQLKNNLDINGVAAYLVHGSSETEIYRSNPRDVFKVQDRRTFDLPSWDCLVDGWKMSWMWRPRVTVHDLVTVPIVVPATAEEGFYGLKIQCSAGRDMNPRAIQILKKWPKDYTIIQLTDTHLQHWDGRGVAQLTGAGDAINKLKPAFVVITGDLTHDNFWDDYKLFVELIDRIQVPTFVLGGNHDNGGMVYEGHADQLLYFGEPYYSFDFGDHHYTGIDNASRFFDEEQVAWMKQDLAANQDKKLRVLFGHGLYQQSKADEEWFNNVLFGEYNIALYIYGHFHGDNKQSVRDGKTLTVCSEATVDKGRYTVFLIKDGQVGGVDFRYPEP